MLEIHLPLFLIDFLTKVPHFTNKFNRNEFNQKKLLATS